MSDNNILDIVNVSSDNDNNEELDSLRDRLFEEKKTDKEDGDVNDGENIDKTIENLTLGTLKLNSPERITSADADGNSEMQLVEEIHYDFKKITVEIYLSLLQYPRTAVDLDDKITSMCDLPSLEGRLVAFAYASNIPYAQIKKFDVRNVIIINNLVKSFFIASVFGKDGLK